MQGQEKDHDELAQQFQSLADAARTRRNTRRQSKLLATQQMQALRLQAAKAERDALTKGATAPS